MVDNETVIHQAQNITDLCKGTVSDGVFPIRNISSEREVVIALTKLLFKPKLDMAGNEDNFSMSEGC